MNTHSIEVKYFTSLDRELCALWSQDLSRVTGCIIQERKGFELTLGIAFQSLLENYVFQSRVLQPDPTLPVGWVNDQYTYDRSVFLYQFLSRMKRLRYASVYNTIYAIRK
jgi:hypothetical protein